MLTWLQKQIFSHTYSIFFIGFILFIWICKVISILFLFLLALIVIIIRTLLKLYNIRRLKYFEKGYHILHYLKGFKTFCIIVQYSQVPAFYVVCLQFRAKSAGNIRWKLVHTSCQKPISLSSIDLIIQRCFVQTLPWIPKGMSFLNHLYISIPGYFETEFLIVFLLILN